MEEVYLNEVNTTNLNTNKLVEDEFELLVNRFNILSRQENYVVELSVVAKKIYGLGFLEEIKESFSGLLF